MGEKSQVYTVPPLAAAVAVKLSTTWFGTPLIVPTPVSRTNEFAGVLMDTPTSIPDQPSGMGFGNWRLTPSLPDEPMLATWRPPAVTLTCAWPNGSHSNPANETCPYAPIDIAPMTATIALIFFDVFILCRSLVTFCSVVPRLSPVLPRWPHDHPTATASANRLNAFPNIKSITPPPAHSRNG